jgi:hypothetical protein
MGALAVVLLLVLAAPAPGREPFFGVSLDGVFNEQQVDPQRWDGLLDGVQAAGIRQARTDAFWHWVERGRPFDVDVPLWDWTRTDLMMRAMLEHGIRWTPVLSGPPPWERVERRELHSPPASADHYARFVDAFARRYGRGGSFWSDGSAGDLPYEPVTTYEIWNEPNLSNFWAPRPQPDRYAELYARAREAIKAFDPEAVVMVGGLTAASDAEGFVEAMFAARPDLADAVDAVGIHPYSRTAGGTVAWVRKLRQALDRLGQRGVPLYVSELGWPTQGKYTGRAMSDENRAVALEVAANTLTRGNCDVRGITAYSWVTPQKDPAFDDHWYALYMPGRGLTKAGEAYSALVATNPHERPTAVPTCGSLPAGSGGGPDADSDGDALEDAGEAIAGVSMLDRDTDDDGLGDGAEVLRLRTDPARPDTDRDGLSDGLEQGVSRPIADPAGAVRGTKRSLLRLDRDPRSRTSPLRADSDGDGWRDGREDANRNGRRDRRESDPRRRDR